jgi:hypothetical protein
MNKKELLDKLKKEYPTVDLYYVDRNDYFDDEQIQTALHN